MKTNKSLKEKQVVDNDETETEKLLEIKSTIAEESESFFDLRTKRGQLLFMFVTATTAALITLLPLNQLREIFFQPNQLACNPTCPVDNLSKVEMRRKPTYWIYGAGGEGQWVHVNKVLKRLGFERVAINESETADLLWAHDYPFTKLRSLMTTLKPHQKVNHFPGCGFITNKIDLSTTKLKYIPMAFKLPNDADKLKAYDKENPGKSFVVKHHQHRHINIKKIEDIDFNNNLTFVQEFIDNPLLVDGYKFDIGVYTIITSIDPLRVYIYYGDILFRYCAQKYHPFDPSNVDKYIVGDDYLPTWKIPSLSRYYNGLGLGMKGSFDSYLKSKGSDPQIIWNQVEDAIRLAILNKEPLIKDILHRYKNKRNFFEMTRFDLIVDANLKVYLMEANMSPNLSSAHFKQNFILYEQVIYHVLNLVGVGHYMQRESFEKQDEETELMLSTDKNIMVHGNICSQPPCSESCAPIDCELCKPCLSYSDVNDLIYAYREHMNRGDTKRIFPPRKESESDEVDDWSSFILSPKNKMMMKWFQEKCKENDD
ncbi:CLUMA_CG013519, isoform A, partial [Clunio marinus]